MPLGRPASTPFTLRGSFGGITAARCPSTSTSFVSYPLYALSAKKGIRSAGQRSKQGSATTPIFLEPSDANSEHLRVHFCEGCQYWRIPLHPPGVQPSHPTVRNRSRLGPQTSPSGEGLRLLEDPAEGQ